MTFDYKSQNYNILIFVGLLFFSIFTLVFAGMGVCLAIGRA